MVAGPARTIARRTAQQPTFMQMGSSKQQAPWAEEAGCSGREYHAAELTFSLGQPQHSMSHLLQHGGRNRAAAANPSQPSPDLPWASMVQRLQRSSVATINLQAGTLIIPAIAVTEPLTAAAAAEAQALAARRAVGGHSGAQLWLQEQLSRVPFFRPLALQLSASTATSSAATATGAASSVGPLAQAVAAGAAATGAAAAAATAASAAAASVAVAKRKPLAPPPKMTPEDQQLWDMFVEMDANGDGEIDKSELLRALYKLGLPCSPSYVEQMMRQFSTPSSSSSSSSSSGGSSGTATVSTTAVATATTTATGSSGSMTSVTATTTVTTKTKGGDKARGKGKETKLDGAAAEGSVAAAAASAAVASTPSTPEAAEVAGGTGSIAWEDFRRYVMKREDQIYAAFKEFDRDDNGVVTAWEIGQVLVKAGLPTTGRDIRKVMEVLGKDVSDTISYQEFRKFACFMPSWQVKDMQVHSYAGWLFTAPTVNAAATRRRPNIISDPLQHFMAFDLLIRTCMAGSLALMVVMAIKLD